LVTREAQTWRQKRSCPESIQSDAARHSSPIWRRIQVWEDATLAQLHRVLQMVMGWEDYHLHEFRIGRKI